MSSDKTITRDLLKGLTSGKEEQILAALMAIRASGNAELLPAIISLAFNDPADKVRNEALMLLNDLKDKNSVPYIAEALKTYRGKNGFKNLVASCWQCGLNFSDHLDLFTDIVLHDDFETAFEAFTVIEENILNLGNKGRKELAGKILSTSKTSDEAKNRLIRELELVVAEEISS